ncbi:hypothetical protein [Chthonobacter rhizosphaerae]|uniref:hypothetical protein n=1 Tax=Chthonobacter rhizosphaerae TaxID=2735553 RepID=UPI0015EF3905|nr:hypothetical protein [Chthonobacter rhizosphaerae]
MDRIVTEDLIEETALYPATNLTLVRVVHRATGAVREGRVPGMDHRALLAARAEALTKLHAALAA